MSEGEKIPALPNFKQINKLLQEMGLSTSASEIHGHLCGQLSTGIFEQAMEYMKNLIESVDILKFEKQIKQLITIVDISIKQLTSVSFEFHLLVPDDETALQDRASSLSAWCQGYTDALLHADVDIESIAQEEIRDAFFHITEIASLDDTYDTVTEEDEKAYAEIYEYVRMAAMMIYTELNHATAEGETSSEEEESRTLH